MANEKFWFIFPDKPSIKTYIDEPINFGDADFNLDRKENGMGMDATISGGELKFRFTIHRSHYLEDILYLFHKDGFEADLKFGFATETGQEYIGEVDFYTAKTNDFDYFECSVILESEMQIFKRRMSTKVNLFASNTIDGEVIEPLAPISMLLQAKPTYQISEWKQDVPANHKFVASFPGNTTYAQINPAQNIISSGIEDTYTFYQTVVSNGGGFSESDFKLFLAKDNFKNVVLNVSELFIDFRTDVDNGGNGYVDFYLNVYKGLDFTTALKTTLLFISKTENQTYNFDGSINNIDLGQVLRGESVWLQFDIKLRQSNSIGTFDPKIELFLDINKMKVSISASSTAYNSTPFTFRLIDVMRQVAKSTSNLDIFAPRYENAGQFYDTVLTNGKLLGGNINDPFYVSWEDIEKSIKSEHNADSEIQLDKRVFVGIEKDFYTGEECGFFDTTQFSGLTKKPNPMYCLNEFKFKYSKYQSLKEVVEPNSGSTIHGESIFTPFNKKVENSKECTIEWTRDAVLLDVQQRLSTKIPEDTATQDDDTIFAIDTIETVIDQKFTETTIINHTWSSPYLSLRSNGDVNFLVLGIRTGTNFIIEAPDSNSGYYTVYSVSNNEIQLSRISGNSPSDSTNGTRLTKYTYEIKKESIPLTNRTNEGFSVVLNLTSPEKYSNLRYSVQRNIRNYWNSFLATVNLYHKDKPLRNTFYKNNGKCETEYNGLRVIEKEDWIPTDPIVTPFMYENVVFANVDYEDFIALQNALRARRGFVRTIDNNSQVLKLYPIKMSYVNKSRELTLMGQEKFQSAYLTISNANGIILINNETRIRKLRYEIQEGDKVVLFDMQRQRLYNGVYWDLVSINGANAPTLEVLKQWLDLLV